MKGLTGLRAVLVVLLIAGTCCLAWANPGQETGTAGTSKDVVFLVEGSTFGEGDSQQVIAKWEQQIASGELTPDIADLRKYNIKVVREMDALMSAAGYRMVGQDWGWGEPLTQKETNAFLSNSGPDVIIGETQMPGFAAQGFLEPFPADLDAKVRKLCVWGAYSPMEIGGKIYGLSSYPGVNALFWNKALLRKAGLDPEKAPETWDEWLQMAGKVTAAGKGEFFGGGTYAGPNLGGALRVGPFMMMMGGGFVDKNNNIAFNTPGNIEAMKFMRLLAKNSPPGAAGAPAEGAWWDAFAQQKIAYVVDGPWRLSVSQSLGIECGYSSLPHPAGKERANVTIGVCFYSVPKYAANKKGAFKFIESLVDKKVQDLVFAFGQRPPVLKSYGDDKAFLGSYIGAFYKGIQGQVKGLPTYKGEQSNKIWDVFCQYMTRAIVTEDDIATVLKEAQSQCEPMQK